MSIEEGITVRQYLERAGLTVARGEVVTVNGDTVRNLDNPVELATVIVIAGRVANG